MYTISIYNTKGGVGKTSLANAISKDMKLNYITNDHSLTLMKLSKSRYIKNNIPLLKNTLYDFGGFESKDALDICSNSDIVIIPTINDMNAVSKTLSLLKKLDLSKVIVVITMIENQKDFDQVHMVLSKKFPDLKHILKFSKTRILKNSIEKGISPTELFTKNKIYKKSFEEYSEILLTIYQKLNMGVKI